jgi:hypothetical protein
MYKTISNKIIRQFNPCYDPSDVIKDENEELTVKEWVQKYRKVIPAKDIIWLLLRDEFMSEKDLRLFGVWCARELLKLIKNSDERSVEACNVVERYANGEATKEELDAAYIAADNVADTAHDAARAAYDAADAANTAYVATDADYIAYYAALAVANAASAAANAASAAANAASSASDTVSRAAANAARAAYFAALADSDTVSRADADAAYDVTRISQLDKLLTYFE